MNFSKKMLPLLASAMLAAPATAQDFIGKQTPTLTSDLMTPEVLWQMGRIGGASISPDGKSIAYAVSYYSKEQNKSHSVLYTLTPGSGAPKQLTTSTFSEGGAVFLDGGKQIAFLSSESGTSQLWLMNADGTNRRQISHEADDVNEFLFSPDEKKVILIKMVPMHESIAAPEPDLPKATGMVINDALYKHWDHYVDAVPHPFVASFDGTAVSGAKDLLEGEPYECPMEPFGGVEQLAWSPDSKTIAYTCKKKVGLKYAISTDSDIFLYSLSDGTTKNLCKPAGYVEPEADPIRSFEHQDVNHQNGDLQVGYDQNPQFSPDGKRIAWLSMEREGYESDRTRLCVYELATGEKKYLTESLETGVNEFVWAPDSRTLYFTAVWHGTTNIYATNLDAKVSLLVEEQADYSLVGIFPDGRSLLAKRVSMQHPADLYRINLAGGKATAEQLTDENKPIFDQLAIGDVQPRWVKTTDGKDMLCWVVYPPHFDKNKKYPTLLFCEGGPQSPVSQFWSYRWNFQIMAAHGYIIIAPNRRGLPGFGMEWLEEISGDYSGQCMRDYLSAIDDIAKESYVDADRLGAVGASFGGYSVYWLAGNHDGRFKALIAHDGIYNTQQQYVETEEMWFTNWDLGGAPWTLDNGQTRKAYAESPHLYVDKWTAPILCIHGQKDFRIEYTQAESAFNAARARGIPAQLLLFPDENHWVLKPQNGILWQRTFFRWLDKYLK